MRNSFLNLSGSIQFGPFYIFFWEPKKIVKLFKKEFEKLTKLFIGE
jgi:hypothetical protein